MVHLSWRVESFYRLSRFCQLLRVKSAIILPAALPSISPGCSVRSGRTDDNRLAVSVHMISHLNGWTDMDLSEISRTGVPVYQPLPTFREHFRSNQVKRKRSYCELHTSPKAMTSPHSPMPKLNSWFNIRTIAHAKRLVIKHPIQYSSTYLKLHFVVEVTPLFTDACCALLSDAEGREDLPEYVIGQRLACDVAERRQGSVQFQ